MIENKPDYLVCTCMGVMYSEIVQAIQNGNKTFESLQETLLLGTGCSSCVDETYQILRETLKSK